LKKRNLKKAKQHAANKILDQSTNNHLLPYFSTHAVPITVIVILMTVIGIVCSSPPLLLAWLTYDKMVKVLMENRDPHTKWAKTLEWLGYFLGLFIAGLMIYIANKKIEYSKHT
jgi:hypothetical protein